MGVLPGRRWATPEDRLVVVGAHWDTVINTGGLDDNGSGVSAMLELGTPSDLILLIVGVLGFSVSPKMFYTSKQTKMS